MQASLELRVMHVGRPGITGGCLAVASQDTHLSFRHGLVVALAAFRIALAGDPTAALYTLAAGVALFAATFLLFWRGLLGGGDVKLLVATGLLIGYHDLFQFLFVMSVCGALVAVAVLAHNRLGGRVTASAPEHQEPPEPHLLLQMVQLMIPSVILT